MYNKHTMTAIFAWRGQCGYQVYVEEYMKLYTKEEAEVYKYKAVFHHLNANLVP